MIWLTSIFLYLISVGIAARKLDNKLTFNVQHRSFCNTRLESVTEDFCDCGATSRQYVRVYGLAFIWPFVYVHFLIFPKRSTLDYKEIEKMERELDYLNPRSEQVHLHLESRPKPKRPHPGRN